MRSEERKEGAGQEYYTAVQRAASSGAPYAISCIVRILVGAVSRLRRRGRKNRNSEIIREREREKETSIRENHGENRIMEEMDGVNLLQSRNNNNS